MDAFTRAGGWVQREKLNKGIALDCPKSSYTDGPQIDVPQYTDNPA